MVFTSDNHLDLQLLRAQERKKRRFTRPVTPYTVSPEWKLDLSQPDYFFSVKAGHNTGHGL